MENDVFALQPIRHSMSTKDSENSNSLNLKSSAISSERLTTIQNIKNTLKTPRSSIPTHSTLIINLPNNDSITGIERSPNVVQNFLSERDPKNLLPASLNWQSALRNVSYILSWYFFSTALSFYNKALMGKDYYNLNLPLFVSAMHAVMHFLVTSVFMSNSFPVIYKRPEGQSISFHSYMKTVAPCALATAFEICMANASLMYITLSFYTMVKSSTPIWVLVFAFVFGLEQPRFMLIFIILVISIGVVLTVFGETAFNMVGFLLVLGAAIVSGLRWSLTQILLQNMEGINNPIATLYYISPIMFVMMIILSLIFEDPFGTFGTSEHFKDVGNVIQTVGLVLVGGFLAFCMTMSELSLIKCTSTVTLSVAGISKEVLIIALSMLIYHDKLSGLNLLGLVISIAGIAWYNWYKIRKSDNQDKKGRYQTIPLHAKNNSLD